MVRACSFLEDFYEEKPTWLHCWNCPEYIGMKELLKKESRIPKVAALTFAHFLSFFKKCVEFFLIS